MVNGEEYRKIRLSFKAAEDRQKAREAATGPLTASMLDDRDQHTLMEMKVASAPHAATSSSSAHLCSACSFCCVIHLMAMHYWNHVVLVGMDYAPAKTHLVAQF